MKRCACKRLSTALILVTVVLMFTTPAVAGKSVDRAVLVTDGFRFSSVRGYRDANFVPGAVKYGDVIEGVTMQEQLDEVTGLSRKRIIDLL